jgi:tRNA nucleotidyltransferase (CCA-adding enzyme)
MGLISPIGPIKPPDQIGRIGQIGPLGQIRVGETHVMLIDSNFIPSDVRGLIEQLFRSGFDAWLVGGALRDFMMGLTPKDWDIGTNATPQQVMVIFSKVIPIGIRHGTVEVLTGSRHVEVTALEGPGRQGILGDLERRDFTVNALAYSCRTGELLDPHLGLRDLRALILRAVGDARSRFREDPLRTLRAGRFVSVYGFRIHRSTFQALKREVEGIDLVAKERIREEMFKMLMGEHIVEAFEWMRRGGVLRKVLPELMSARPKTEGCGYYEHTVSTVRHSPKRLTVRLAALLHDIAGPPRSSPTEAAEPGSIFSCEASALVASAVMERWRVSNRLTEEVLTLVRNQLLPAFERPSDAQIRHLLARVGAEHIGDLLDLAHADRLAGADNTDSLEELATLRSMVSEQLNQKPPLTIGDLAIDGHDIMRILDLEPGPMIGRILCRLHYEVLENPGLNQRRLLKAYLKNMSLEALIATRESR